MRRCRSLKAFFPKAMFARRWRGSSMCRPCGPWSSFACSAKIAPVMSSCWERTMAAICRRRRLTFRPSTLLRKSPAILTVPSPSFVQSIAYPLLAVRRKSRSSMMIARLWPRAGLRHWRERRRAILLSPRQPIVFRFWPLTSSCAWKQRGLWGSMFPMRPLSRASTPPFFRCPPLRSRKRGGIRRRHAPDVAAGAPGGLLPSYRPHFGREVRDTKNPSRSGYGRHFGGLCCTTH